MITINGWRRETSGDTIIILTGTDDETGDLVEVAADHRMAGAIIYALTNADRDGNPRPKVDPDDAFILRRQTRSQSDG